MARGLFRHPPQPQQRRPLPPQPESPLKSSSDSGVGTDAASVAAALSGSETGAATEAASLAAAVPASDSGVGTDSRVNIGLASSDSGVGTDSGAVAAAVPASDSGTGTDSRVNIGLSASDSGVGTESATVTSGYSGTESGTGTDTGAVAAAVPGSDVGTGTDSASVQASVPASESGAGTETGAVVAALPGSETGTGTDAATLAAAVPASDSGVGTDSATVTVAISASDSGVGTDAASLDAGFDPATVPPLPGIDYPWRTWDYAPDAEQRYPLRVFDAVVDPTGTQTSTTSLRLDWTDAAGYLGLPYGQLLIFRSVDDPNVPMVPFNETGSANVGEQTWSDNYQISVGHTYYYRIVPAYYPAGTGGSVMFGAPSPVIAVTVSAFDVSKSPWQEQPLHEQRSNDQRWVEPSMWTEAGILRRVPQAPTNVRMWGTPDGRVYLTWTDPPFLTGQDIVEIFVGTLDGLTRDSPQYWYEQGDHGAYRYSYRDDGVQHLEWWWNNDSGYFRLAAMAWDNVLGTAIRGEPSPLLPALPNPTGVHYQPDLSLQEALTTYPRWYQADLDAERRAPRRAFDAPTNVAVEWDGPAGRPKVTWTDPAGMTPGLDFLLLYESSNPDMSPYQNLGRWDYYQAAAAGDQQVHGSPINPGDTRYYRLVPHFDDWTDEGRGAPTAIVPYTRPTDYTDSRGAPLWSPTPEHEQRDQTQRWYDPGLYGEVRGPRMGGLATGLTATPTSPGHWDLTWTNPAGTSFDEVVWYASTDGIFDPTNYTGWGVITDAAGPIPVSPIVSTYYAIGIRWYEGNNRYIEPMPASIIFVAVTPPQDVGAGYLLPTPEWEQRDQTQRWFDRSVLDERRFPRGPAAYPYVSAPIGIYDEPLHFYWAWTWEGDWIPTYIEFERKATDGLFHDSWTYGSGSGAGSSYYQRNNAERGLGYETWRVNTFDGATHDSTWYISVFDIWHNWRPVTTTAMDQPDLSLQESGGNYPRWYAPDVEAYVPVAFDRDITVTESGVGIDAATVQGPYSDVFGTPLWLPTPEHEQRSNGQRWVDPSFTEAPGLLFKPPGAPTTSIRYPTHPWFEGFDVDTYAGTYAVAGINVRYGPSVDDSIYVGQFAGAAPTALVAYVVDNWGGGQTVTVWWQAYDTHGVTGPWGSGAGTAAVDFQGPGPEVLFDSSYPTQAVDQTKRWYAPEPFEFDPMPRTSSSVAQRADLWIDQSDQQSVSTAQRWVEPNVLIVNEPPKVYLWYPDDEALSHLWLEQPGQERTIYPTWYHRSTEPVNDPQTFVSWLWWVAAGPPAPSVGGGSAVLIDVDSGDVFLNLGGPLIVKAT